MKHVLGVAALAIAVWSAPAPAYEIKAKRSVHESITRLALKCLARDRARQAPEDCKADYARIGATGGIPRSWFTNFKRLETAPRWSDDPTRDLYSPGGAVRFLRETWLKSCEEGDNAEEELSTPHGRGLTCGSHYGRLQFLHAMAAPDEEADVAGTRRKVIDWAMFSYGVATGRVPLDADYCTYVRANTGTIGRELAPDDFPYCGSPGSEGWRVATLFSLKCWLPFGPGGCTEYLAEGWPRRAAAGALLHAIQDSYSQSHVIRGTVPPDGRFEPRADCGFPARFYAYTPENQEHHSKADAPPARGEGCGDAGAADDVVTASAVAIWHLCENSDPAKVRRFLETRVFGRSGEADASDPPAGPAAGSPAPFPKRCAAIGQT